MNRRAKRKHPVSYELRSWRKTHKLSQSVAAVKLNISMRTLQEWEQGRAAPHHLALDALRNKLKALR